MINFKSMRNLNEFFHRLCFLSIGFLFVFIFCVQSWASPASLTYQGRILKSDGAPLEYNNVSFVFQITNPAGTCVIYQEQVTGFDMTNSAGVFDVPIGNGTVQYPLNATTTILDVFNNSSSFTCGSCSSTNGNYTCANGTSTYAASASDVRKLRVSFYDGKGWKTITPDNTIRSVPFAGYALSAQKLGNNIASDFLTKAGLPNCGAGTFLSWDGAQLTCQGVVGASGGTVTNVSSGNSYVTITNGSTAPQLTLNVGTGANTVAAGNDPRIVNAVQSGSASSGDLSGTYPGPTVVALQGVGVSATIPTSGQVLKFNGTNWTPAGDNNAGGTVTSVSGTAPIAVATGTTTPVISISQATTSTNGYLSSADWNIFNNKQSALGFTPLNPSNNLSDVANVATSRTNLGLGTAAVKNFPGAGNAAATEVVLGSDTRLTDSRIPTGSAGGDLTGNYPNPILAITGVAAGTYPKVTVDTKGRVTAAGSLVAADIPNLDWSKITTGKPTTLSGYGITNSLVVNGGNTGSISSGLDAAKPGTPAFGDLFVATDIKRIYRYNGTTWDQLADATSTGGITALTGDVSATGPGSVASTVNNVGGKTATAIATSVSDTVAATNLSTNSTIVKRDASGNFSAGTITANLTGNVTGSASLNVLKSGDTMTGNLTFASNKGNVFTDSGTNNVTIQAPTTISTSYVLKLPTAQGSSNQLMINDGSGNLSWTTLSSLGGVTSVTAAGTAGNPVTIGGTATAPTVDLTKASTSTSGYLSSTDWNTFNNKQSASLADAKIWVGQTGTPAAVTPSGDVSMTNAGAFTVTGIRGKSVSATAPSSAGQVLRYDGASSYVPAFLGLADLKSTITPFGGAFASSGCAASQTLYWQSSTDTFQCQSVTINDSQLSYTASRTANTFLAAPNGSAGAASFRTIASADLPAGTLSGSGTTGYVPYYSATTTLANSSMFISGSNVGIGTTSPSQMLHVVGNIRKDISASSGGTSYWLMVNNDGAGNWSEYINSTGGATPTAVSEGAAFRNVFSPSLISSNSNIYYQQYAAPVTAGATQSWKNYVSIDAKNNYLNLMDGGGNVGIGTTTPTAALDIAPPSSGTITQRVQSGSGQYPTNLLLSPSTHATSRRAALGVDDWYILQDTNGNGTKDFSIWQSSAPAHRFYISPAGNVGIGTVSPGSKLDVVANGTGISFDPGNGSTFFGALGFNREAGTGAMLSSSAYGYQFTHVGSTTNTSDYFTLQVYNPSGGLITNNALAVNGTGNVGIGTTIPGALLEVNAGSVSSYSRQVNVIDTSATGAPYIFVGDSTNHGMIVGHTNSGGTNYGWLSYWGLTPAAGQGLFLNSSGSVGIGTTNPTQVLDVNGAAQLNAILGGQLNSAGNLHIDAHSSGGDRGVYLNWVQGIGGLKVGNGAFNYGPVYASAFTVSSDRRLKENIRPIGQALDKILQLDGVTFNWKDKKRDEIEGQRIGLIAQNVEQVFPQAVKTDHGENTLPGGTKVVAYSDLVAPVIAAIKEFYHKWFKDSQQLHEIINQQSREIASIKDENRQVKTENEKMKAENQEIKSRLDRLEKLIQEK